MPTPLTDPDTFLLPSLPNSIPTVSPAIWTINVTNFVSTSLDKVEGFLTWKTQFMYFLVMHQLHGFLDGSISQLPPYISTSLGHHQPNPAYQLQLRLDQLIHTWIFVTLSKNHVMEV